MMPIDRLWVAHAAKRRLARLCAATGAFTILTTASSFAQEAAPESATAPVVGAAALPRDLSPWGMFQSADAVVKGVLIALALASIVTWTIWLAKTLEILVAKRRARVALRRLAAVASLADVGVVPSPASDMLAAARTEIRVSADAFDQDGLKERIASRLERIEAAFARRISRATGVLATIGATAPFVGLFGTVWGIMNSFIGISKAQTTNLAVVAPGIAEALLATAIGLVAAIPAVIIYNHFSRATKAYLEYVGRGSGAVGRLLSRDLDRSRDRLLARAAE